MEQNENVQFGDSNVKMEIKWEHPSEYNFEIQSPNIFEESIEEVVLKKTVICTEDEFVQDFGGIVESKIELGNYEMNGAIKCKQNEPEQLNQTFTAVISPTYSAQDGREVIFRIDVDLSKIRKENTAQIHSAAETDGKGSHINKDKENVSKEIGLSEIFEPLNGKTVTTNGKLVQCDICDKKFSKSYFPIHVRLHTGEKPFKCGVCGRGFSQQQNLQRHGIIHTGERPFKCGDCDKTFSRQSHLKQHERIHTGEKLFKCTECGKGFTQQSNLRTHNRIHTGEKPYNCGDCGEMYSNLSSFREHKKLHIRTQVISVKSKVVKSYFPERSLFETICID